MVFHILLPGIVIAISIIIFQHTMHQLRKFVTSEWLNAGICGYVERSVEKFTLHKASVWRSFFYFIVVTHSEIILSQYCIKKKSFIHSISIPTPLKDLQKKLDMRHDRMCEMRIYILNTLFFYWIKWLFSKFWTFQLPFSNLRVWEGKNKSFDRFTITNVDVRNKYIWFYYLDGVYRIMPPKKSV